MLPCMDWRGHKFQPRYDEEPLPFEVEECANITQFVKAYTKRTYVCDVCVRCGEIIKRPENTI